MKNKNLAFVTSSDDPNLISDDRLAFEPLKNLGYTVSPLVWDDSSQNPSDYDALIFRSCWNYHVKFKSFLEWLEKVDQLKMPVLNSIAINRWNLNKKYLLELEKHGANLPKTSCFSKGTDLQSREVQNFLNGLATDWVVIRPSVSLNGHDTYLKNRSQTTELQAAWNSLPQDRDILVQEYIPEIKTSGEVSLIFFNENFSHAIRKTTSGDEFRIHSEYGGSRQAYNPSPKTIETARKIIALAPEQNLLAVRVDLIERKNDAVLVELEIIDPMLFLGSSPGAPERFAQAIHERLSCY